jgi:hypothetical protein
MRGNFPPHNSMLMIINPGKTFFCRTDALENFGAALGIDFGVPIGLDDQGWNFNVRERSADFFHELFDLNKSADRALQIVDVGIVRVVFHKLFCYFTYTRKFAELIESIQKFGKP